MIAVAVTGIGVVSAFGIGTDRFWQGLLSGHSALAPLQRWAQQPEQGREQMRCYLPRQPQLRPPRRRRIHCDGDSDRQGICRPAPGRALRLHATRALR
mgnify:CR=1 FL=1